MYSLLVSHEASTRSEGIFTIEASRFLEYTDDIISIQLRSLSNEAKEGICSWPCILMQEGRGQERAHLAQIGRLEVTHGEIKATITSLSETEPLFNDALWRMRDNLDIGDFEFNRNHWAIKDRDLFSALTTAGHTVAPATIHRFKQLPLPAPTRQELLKARDVISNWSHTEINDFLLEAGVNELDTLQHGSRRDRANGIVKFIFEHPSVTTADNFLLSAFLVRQTLRKNFGDDGPEAERSHETGTANSVPFKRPTEASRSPNRVFVVHGQNDRARDGVVSFLESLGLKGIVLHEQPNMGRHLLTKFIEEAELVTFAVVLMTDDDVGGATGKDLSPRARQNVILELGYFLAHLGQPRVCALITPGLETPSDFDGIVYIRMDESGLWQKELNRELIAAKMPLNDCQAGP
jgi:predicted nucleotide-binding protein